MSDNITRARESLSRRGGSIPLIRALDEVLVRGLAAEKGLMTRPDSREWHIDGYRTATLELAEHIATALLKEGTE